MAGSDTEFPFSNEYSSRAANPIMEDIKIEEENDSPGSQSNEATELTKDICSFYIQGKCRFGDNCFNLHEGCVVEKQSPKSVKKKEKYFNDQNSHKKKPPLRTAGDVRKRIQWDSDLPSEHFVVGYIDRFDGVIEKSFDEFSWKHLATVDLDELAIPQHRIQYYKYKGCKVWDKSLRLDNVFGSAGNQKTILQVMAEVDEELDNKEQFSDDESDDDVYIVSDRSSGNTTVGSIKQAEIQQQFEEKLRATHFLCIRVKSPSMVNEIKEVQDYIIESDPDLRSCAMPTEILHVTLAMIKCDTPDSIERVNEILEDIKTEIKSLKEYDTKENIIRAKNLSTFGARVLYSKLETSQLFNEIVKLLQKRLEKEEEVIITNHFDFVPHMTLLKVNRVVAKLRRSKYINSSLYEKYLYKDFGTIQFNNIHFCVINDMRGLDNFYLTHKVIEF